MALSSEIKEILACPACKGELEFREQRAEIVCLACRLVFSIEEGIPNMLVDDARPLRA